MDKYNKAFTSLVIMLSGALREEFIGNEKIQKDLETLQELIDICSQPNSIKSKLDHIQDVIDSCYETDEKGNLIKSEFNDDIDLADEYLQDIKKAYSFRVEDTRIVNELQELLGNCCVDYINTKVQELMGDLELYKKALKLFIKDMSDIKVNKDDCFVKFVCTNTDCNECIENRYLTLARKELENGK